MKLLIFDFLNLFHRAYHAYPRTLATKDGLQTNAVYGFSNILLNTINKLGPSHVIVATETGPSFRHLAFAPYKENRGWRKERPEEAEEFDKQIPYANEILETLNIPVISAQGFEADDVIGTLCKNPKSEFLNSKQFEVIIVSSDQDFLQLIDQNVKVFRPAKPPYIKEKIWDQEEVRKVYKMEPVQLIDFKALRGDPSDNIPGVFGIGEKTALRLVQEYQSIESIYSHISQVSPISLRVKLAEGAEQAVMCKKLASIVTIAPISYNLEDCLWGNYNKTKLQDLFIKLEFNSLISKIIPKPSTHLKAENPNQLGLL